MDPARSNSAGPRTSLGAPPGTAANRAAAEQLKRAAEAACAHSEEGMEAVIRRRSAQPKPTPETMERIERTVMRLEIARSRMEMHRTDLETVRRARREDRETAELERWIRAHAASMLSDGWTLEELADIGIDARYTGEPASPDAESAR